MRDTNTPTTSCTPRVTRLQATLIERYLAGRKKKRKEPVRPKYKVPLVDSEKTHSAIIVASKETCGQCQGTGKRTVYKTHSVVCGCVYRSCFGKCISRYRNNLLNDYNLCQCSIERSSVGTTVYGYKNIEFGADIELIAKRVLSPIQYFIFRRYHVLGLVWSVVSDRAKMNRGNFFHAVYALEEKLGRALMETDMFPPHKYFSKRSMEFPQIGRMFSKSWPATSGRC